MSNRKEECKCGKLKDYRAVQCRSCKDAEPMQKMCNGCKTIFPIDEYNLRPNGRGGYKRRSRCKECENAESKRYRLNNLDECKKRKKNYDRAHPEKVSEWSFKTRMRRMGLDPEQVLEYVNLHDGVCEICGDKPTFRKLAVDHCHEKNILRGLLCSRCNIGIGQFRDNPKLLMNAIKYLEKHL